MQMQTLLPIHVLIVSNKTIHSILSTVTSQFPAAQHCFGALLQNLSTSQKHSTFNNVTMNLIPQYSFSYELQTLHLH